MKSIRRNLSAGLLIGLFLLFAGFGAALYYYTQRALLKAFDSALITQSRALAALVKNEDERIEFEAPLPGSMPEFEHRRSPYFFQIWMADGTVLARSPSLGNRNLHKRSGASDDLLIWNLELPNGRRGRAVQIQFNPGGEEEEKEGEWKHNTERRSGKKQEHEDEHEEKNKTEETHEHPVIRLGEKAQDSRVIVMTARDRHELDETLGMLLSSLLVGGLLMPVGAIGIVLLTVRRGLRPLERVADQASRIEASTLENRFPADEMPIELQSICRRLNDLLARLEEAFHRERRFTSDVAHELRTPIAELRSLAEVAQKWPGDAEATQNFFRDVAEIACQMERQATVLLSLARCEARRQEIALEPLDLATRIQEAWRPFDNQARSRNLKIVFDLAPLEPVQSDRAMVDVILSNLFDNAVSYCASPGEIMCRTGVENGRPVMILSNPVDNLASEDLLHLFEPFWRKDPARSDSTHSGLGLALVAALSRLLGIEIEAVLPAADQFCIRVRFPLPKDVHAPRGQ